ncbi:unnamed protein product [Fraxinus pennsylvanica]|uniref:J domain-containing protein n=1 Tax=Fraxinus pennsylvanica TaxID=56036 RepID=A0AAD2AF51_9LAMI|nr:unnamed protein product [Fraxinus pennsylvanica]
MLQSELKHQRKLVRSLKKKSLWSKHLEEVVEMLVDVVSFIHQDIIESFGDNGLTSSGRASTNRPERLGVAGLSLHYANIITQIDNIASRPTSLPSNMRETLYNGLPPTVKNALRSRLQTIDTKEELTVPQIKAEMEKTLQWLVPLALDTTKAHQGFGWVGEWANSGNEFGKKTGPPNNLIRLQTFYHAEKQKADSYILELVAWLHRLVSLVTYRDNGLKAQPVQSPTLRGSNTLSSNNNAGIHKVQLSPDDKNLLDKVTKRKNLAPGLSKSQEFTTVQNRKNKVWALSRSTGSSPRRGLEHLKAFSLTNQILGPKFSPPSPPRHVGFRCQLPISATSATASSSSNVSQTASLYELLGIQMGASDQEIKNAYRRLARILHPDVASQVGDDDTSAADQFMRVHAAYATLSDPQKRANYDLALYRRRMGSQSPSASGFTGYTARNRNWETDQCW